MPMKKVKVDWKRSLACELYEEKQNGWRDTLGGILIFDNEGFKGEEFNGEGMDLLWEVYEETAVLKDKKISGELLVDNVIDVGRKTRRSIRTSTTCSSTEDDLREIVGSRGMILRHLEKMNSRKMVDDQEGGEEEEEEEDDDQVISPAVCCMSALKLSTRKVALNGLMAISNLFKISKTIGRLGLLKDVIPYKKKRRV